MSKFLERIVIYTVKDSNTTMRSARKSFLLGTLSPGDYFYHYHSDPTREGDWVWGYTPKRYGCLNGFGWVPRFKLKREEHQKLPVFGKSIEKRLRNRERWVDTLRYKGDRLFRDEHTYPGIYPPTPGKQDAEYKVTIKPGIVVPFYVNQIGGNPLPQRHAKSYFTSVDTPETHGKGNLNVRFVTRQNPNLMVANFIGNGRWGFILRKSPDDFTITKSS